MTFRIRLAGLTFFGFCAIILSQAQTETRRASTPVSVGPVASGLDWYARWVSSDTVYRGEQICRGEYRDAKILMSCKPINALLGFYVGAKGEYQLSSIGPDFRMPSMFLSIPAPSHIPAGMRHHCEGVPFAEGPFVVSIGLTSYAADLQLSNSARESASRYLRSWAPPCVAHFPRVHFADPLFHVYVTCGEKLRTILEFEVRPGKKAEFRGDVSFWNHEPDILLVKHLSNSELSLSRSEIGRPRQIDTENR